MKNIFISCLAVISLLAITNCASLTGPSKQPIKVNSVPAGAEVKIGNRSVITPGIIEVPGKSEYLVTAHKDGYQDKTDVLGSEVRIGAAIVGNIFNFTGIIGMAVDFLGTGAAYRMDKEVNVTLQPQAKQ